MLRRIPVTLIVLGCLTFTSTIAAKAQEVVHALTGTIKSIDAGGKTITIFTDKGSEATFQCLTNPQTRLVFDKKIRADAKAADTFKDMGYVIVFYFGNSDVRTAVALRALGAGPFTSGAGTVVKFAARARSVSIKDESGAIQSFKLTADTVAETGVGVLDGSKFHSNEGDRVRIVAKAEDGSPSALFIHAM